MSGTLYTCRLADINKTPEDSLRLFITLYAKQTLIESLAEKYNVIHTPALAPSPTTFSNYKQNKDTDRLSAWSKYVDEYCFDIINNKKKVAYLNRIKEILKEGRDVTLICYCSDKFCHRHILRRYFENYNINTMEVSKNV